VDGRVVSVLVESAGMLCLICVCRYHRTGVPLTVVSKRSTHTVISNMYQRTSPTGNTIPTRLSLICAKGLHQRVWTPMGGSRTPMYAVPPGRPRSSTCMDRTPPMWGPGPPSGALGASGQNMPSSSALDPAKGPVTPRGCWAQGVNLCMEAKPQPASDARRLQRTQTKRKALAGL
jgi:hypothetical protein